MSGVVGNVIPRGQFGDSFYGGVHRPTAPPTSIPADTLGGFESSGAPPGMSGGMIRRARNDRGTNVQVPYARLVRNTSSANSQPSLADTGTDYSGGPKRRRLGGDDDAQLKGLTVSRLAFVHTRQKGCDFRGQGRLHSAGGIRSSANSPSDRLVDMCSFEWLRHLAKMSGKRPADEQQEDGPPDAADMLPAGVAAEKVGKTLHGMPIAPVCHPPLNAAAGYDARVANYNEMKADHHTVASQRHLAVEAHGGLLGMRNMLIGYLKKATNALADAEKADRGKVMEEIAKEGDIFDDVMNTKMLAGRALAPVEAAAVGSGRFAATGTTGGDALVSTQLCKAGVFDWVPDGVVVGMVDADNDAARVADHHRLLNIAVLGSAMSSSIEHDGLKPRLPMNPGDDVYLLLTALVRLGAVAYTGEGKAENYAAALVMDMAKELSTQRPDDKELRDLLPFAFENTTTETDRDDFTEWFATQRDAYCTNELLHFTNGKKWAETAHSAYDLVNKFVESSPRVNDNGVPQKHGAHVENLRLLRQRAKAVFNALNVDIKGPVAAFQAAIKTKVDNAGSKAEGPLGSAFVVAVQLMVAAGLALPCAAKSNLTGKNRTQSACMSAFRYKICTTAHMFAEKWVDPRPGGGQARPPVAKVETSETHLDREMCVGAWRLGHLIDASAAPLESSGIASHFPTRSGVQQNLHVSIRWECASKLAAKYAAAGIR